MKDSNQMTHEAHTTIKNISTVAVLKLLQYPFLALTVVLVPRAMGSSVYGKYALIISVITVASALIDFGASGELFGRFVPEFQVRQQPHLINKLASNVMGMRIGIGFITILILFPLLNATYGDRFTPSMLAIVCAVVLVRQIQSVPYALLYGLNRLGLANTLLPLRRALSLILILLLFQVFGFIGAVVSTLIVDLILTANAFVWTFKRFRLSDLKIDWSFLKPLLGFDVVLYMSAVVLSVWQRSGNLLIERLTGDPRQVALFDIPNQAYLVTVTMIFIAIDSLVPVFASLLLTGREQKLRSWSIIIAKYTAALAAMIFWGFFFTGRYVVPIVLGADYESAIPNGNWLLAALFPMAITQLGLVFSVSYKQPLRYFVALCCSFAVFLAASFIFIPQYGSVGCAIATLASSIASAMTLYLSFRQHLGVAIARGVSVMALGVIYMPFLLLRRDLLSDSLLYVAATCVYLLALFLVRILHMDEVSAVISSVRHRSAPAT
jgi:O-antigen/teichoic acid export membrane protein